MELKKDIFYDTLANPEMTLPDLAKVWDFGRNADIQSRDFYKNNKKVQDYFTKNGEFNETAFESAYTTALEALNTVSKLGYNEEVLSNIMYDVDNIWVDPSQRKVEAKPIITINPNPNRLTTGIYRLGRTTEPTQSIDEIAQTQKVLLNPVEVANGAKAEWGDSPNDGWFKDFFKTRVMAAWDEDGTHIDPLTGVEMQHQAGEYKLNENGTYYYEDLEGRSVYGKLVLNKLNTITTDGSRWNQYDFFDSDDLKLKSVGKTLAKNLALVGPMFLPVVGPAVAGISVLTQVAGLGAKGTKMLAGLFNIETPGLNNMEGFLKSTNRSYAKTTEALQRPWCIENIIGMFGDVAGLLKEQRAIFEYVPAIFKGKYGIMDKGLETLHAEKKAEFLKEINTNQKMHEFWRENLSKYGVENFRDRFVNPIEGIAEMVAEKGTRAYFKEYNKLGEQIARAYMTAITVLDTYEEAKLAGATDLESVLVTMGYAAAENALLKSDIGRWIFPELKQESVRNRMIAKKLTELPADVKAVGSNLEAATEKEKMNWMKRLIKIGKDVASRDYSAGKSTVGMMIANGLAEGFEEVSEEALADFSKGCFNLVLKIQGDDTRMDDLFTNFNLSDDFSRYALNFIGGLGGGALNSIKTNYNMLKDYSKMSKEDAQKAIIWMDANDELGDFWESLEKIPLGNKKLSFNVDPTTGLYTKGTKENNQDLAIKTALRNQMKFIHDTVNAEGAKLSDDSVIKKIINIRPDLDAKYGITKSLRYSAWANSATAGWYLKQWNDNLNDLVLAHKEIFDIQLAKSSDSAELSEEQLKQLEVAKRKLVKAQERKDALLKGENALEFLKPVLFETNFGISSTFTAANAIQFAELMSGRKYADMDKDELESWDKKWAAYNSSGSKAEQIATMSEAYWDLIARSGNALKQTEDFYNNITQSLNSKLKAELDFSQRLLESIKLINKEALLLSEEEVDPLTIIQQTLGNANSGDLLSLNISSINEGTIINIEPIVTKLTLISRKYNDEAKVNLVKDINQRILESLAELKATSNRIKQLTSRPTRTEAEEEELHQALQQISEFQLLIEASNKELERLLDPNAEVNLDDDRAYDMALEKSTYLLDTLYKGLLNLSDEVINTGFAHPEVKNNIIQALKNAVNNIVKNITSTAYFYEDESTNAEHLYATREALRQKITAIEALPDSPLIQMMETITSNIDQKHSVVDTIKLAIEKTEATKENLSDFSLNNTEEIDNAIKALELYRAVLCGTRTDDLDIINLSGNTLLLNTLLPTEEKLYEMSSATADLVLNDINLAIQRLEDAKIIHTLNAGNKLASTSKDGLNLNFISYAKVKLFISILDDDDIAKDWKGASGEAIRKLKEAFDNLETTRTYSANGSLKNADRKFSIPAGDKIIIAKEGIILGDAIHDFLLDNISILNSDKSDEALAKLLQKFNVTDLSSNTKQPFTSASDTVNDASFIAWLGTHAVLSQSQFLNLKRNTTNFSGDKPIISTAIQDEALMMLVAAYTNRDLLAKFGRARNRMIENWWDSLDDTLKKEIAPKLGMEISNDNSPLYYLRPNVIKNTDIYQQYLNINFVEGVAGSGKTSAVLGDSLNMAEQVKSMKKIVFAHVNKKNAEDAVKNLRISDDLKAKISTFGRKDLMSTIISSDWKDSVSEDGKSAIYVDAEDGGNVRWLKSRDGKLHSIYDTKKLASIEDKPDLLVIDEWATYTQADAELIQRWAYQNGVPVWTFGDLTLLLPQATYYTKKSEIGLDNKAITLLMDRFVQTPSYKIGTSMRTDNMLKSNNLNLIEANEITESGTPIKLQWAETEEGLYGDKVFGFEAVGEKTAIATNLKADITKMVAALNSGEKIGYIYHDTESPIYKMIKDNFDDKVEYFSEAAAHGREARFYIIEPESPKQLGNAVSKAEIDQFRKSVYTGISRSGQFAILIAPTPPTKNEYFNLVDNTRTPDKELLKDAFTALGLIQYGKLKIALIDEILQNKTQELLAVTWVEGKAIKTTESSASAETAETGEETEKTTEEVTEESLSFETPKKELKRKIHPVGTHVWKSTDPHYVGVIIKNDHEFAKKTKKGKKGKSITQYVIKTPSGKLNYLNVFGNEKNKYKFTNKKQNDPFTNFTKGTAFVDITSKNRFTVIDRASKNNSTVVTYSLKDEQNGSIIEMREAVILGRIRKKLWGIDTTSIKSKSKTTSSNTQTKTGKIAAAEDSQVIEPAETLHLPDDYENPTVLAGTSLLDDEYENPIGVSYDPSTGNMDFALHGETFNTFYTGCAFDSNSKVIPPLSKLQINSGNGLYQIDATKFGTESQIIDAIGQLRSICMFEPDLGTIEKEFSEVLGVSGISVEFALVNKSLTEAKGMYAAYNMDKRQKRINLLNDDYDSNVETHHFISAVVYNVDGKAILELPILIPLSPLSILAQLELLGGPLGQNWKSIISSNPTQIYNALKLVLRDICKLYNVAYTGDFATDLKALKNANPKPGYIKLFNLILFWNFTGNGYKTIRYGNNRAKWTPAKYCKNLGNKYVAERKSEVIPRKGIDKITYTAGFTPFSLAQKKGRTYSSIMAVTSDYPELNLGAGRLFVLSTNSQFKKGTWSDQLLLNRYILQQNDKKLPPIVRLEYVNPPEISVMEYVQKMYAHMKAHTDSARIENMYWGLALDPTRIMLAVLTAYGLGNLNPQKDIIDTAISKINLRKGSNYITIESLQLAVNYVIGNTNDTVLERKYRLLESFKDVTYGTYILDALVNIFFKGEVTTTKGLLQLKTTAAVDENFIKAINKVCADAGISGIKAKTKLPNTSEVDYNQKVITALGKTAYLVQHHSKNAWTHPSGFEYLVYSKVDDPKFEFLQSSATTEGFDTFIENCALDSKFENVWKYNDTKDELKFLGGKEVINLEKQDINTFKKQILASKFVTEQLKKGFGNIKKAKDFVKMELDSYVDTHPYNLTESEILEQIIQKFMQEPGGLCVKMTDKTYLFTFLNQAPKDSCLLPKALIDNYRLERMLDLTSEIKLIRFKNPNNNDDVIDIEFKKTDKEFTLTFTNPDVLTTLQESPINLSTMSDQELRITLQTLKTDLTSLKEEQHNNYTKRTLNLLNTKLEDVINKKDSMVLESILKVINEDSNINRCKSFTRSLL